MKALLTTETSGYARITSVLSWDFATATLSTDRMYAHFGPARARIFDVLWRRSFISGADLADHVYAEHADGGPDNARTSIHVLVHLLRPQIAPFGLAIESSRGRGGGYRLVKIRSDSGPVPFVSIGQVAGSVVDKLAAKQDDYNADDDIRKSVQVGLRAVKERMAAGGPAWPKEDE